MEVRPCIAVVAGTLTWPGCLLALHRDQARSSGIGLSGLGTGDHAASLASGYLVSS